MDLDQEVVIEELSPCIRLAQQADFDDAGKHSGCASDLLCRNLAHSKLPPPQDPTVAPCLGPYDGHWGWASCDEQGIPRMFELKQGLVPGLNLNPKTCNKD